MSRRRYISTDISTDSKLAELSQYGTLPLLLYTWAIPHLDDWGRMNGNPRQFKLLVCPALDITVAEVEVALQQIAAAELWCRYQVDSKWFIAIPEANWFKYQTYINKDKRHKNESKIPQPPNADNMEEIPKNTEEHQGVPQNTASPSPSPSPSPLDINNNNNAREEIEINVNDAEESVSETTQTVSEIVVNAHEVDTMATGTRSVAWAEKNWGRPMSPGEVGEINSWCDEFATRGCLNADDVVIEALKQCDYASVRNMKYLKAVLIDWREAGVITVAQVDARETERKSQKNHKRRNKDPGDKLPKPKSDKYEKFYL